MRKLLNAEIKKIRLNPEKTKEITRNPITLMLDNVRSLYNVGSIFRTCDAALAKELILTGFTPYPPRAEIEKTALGAVETVPWRYFKSTAEAVEKLKNEGNKIIAVEITDDSRKYDDLTFDDFPLCLILGNELTGIDNDILSLCDSAIEIPMYGVKHSLNVSVAAGIVLFEAVKIWKSIKNSNT
ncbi:MAG: RNA methyltransferase [Candidatus Kapabacteria bacterium]|nr:RNA methyltransferase [Candidatus Kapabacteria bacterium]